MKSKIYLKEVVLNKDRRFGQNLEYYPSKVEGTNDLVVNALFTRHEVDKAIKRAATNIEDMPKVTFLESIFGK